VIAELAHVALLAPRHRRADVLRWKRTQIPLRRRQDRIELFDQLGGWQRLMRAALDPEQIGDALETRSMHPSPVAVNNRNAEDAKCLQLLERRGIVGDVSFDERDVSGRKELFRAEAAGSTRLRKELDRHPYTGEGRASCSKTARVRRNPSTIFSGLAANEKRM